MWWALGQLIDFYIHRSTTDIAVALVLLLALVIAGFLVLRAWIRYSVRRPQVAHWRTVAGLVAILGVGYALISGVSAVLPTHPERLGLERQRAATLTLVRRSIQQGYYGAVGAERDERALASAEGKAFLALFTVFGTVLDQERFARDRGFLLAETMYRDWDEQNGGQTFSAFQDVVREVRNVVLPGYIAASRALSEGGMSSNREAARERWDTTMRALLDGGTVAPGLGAEAFLRDPAVNGYMGRKLGCFDCELKPDMDRQAFGRELYKWTQAHNVKQALEKLESPGHFETGRDGERAARTYWVPIWALLFSMLGAFTHIFKMIFTMTEYAHRLSFNRVRAADSPLAHQVVRTSSIATAAVVLGIAAFVYFTDNRITGSERYIELAPRMWESSPIVGALAAHWTVNAQGLLYPFTRKIRPSWLGFDSDPLALLPFASALSRKDDYD